MDEKEFVINILDMSKTQYTSAKAGMLYSTLVFPNENTANKLSMGEINTIQKLINLEMTPEEIATKKWISINELTSLILNNKMDLEKAHISILYSLYKMGTSFKDIALLAKRDIDEVTNEIIMYEHQCYIEEAKEKDETEKYIRLDLIEKSRIKDRNRNRNRNRYRYKRAIPHTYHYEELDDNSPSDWEIQSLEKWKKIVEDSKPIISEEKQKKLDERKEAEKNRREQEKQLREQERVAEIKRTVAIEALNAKNGTFIDEEELKRKKHNYRDVVRKKVLKVGNEICYLEDFGGVDEIRYLMYICNKYYTYDIVVAFMQISKLQDRIIDWSEEDRVVLIDNVNKYKASFIQKAKNGMFINSDEQEYTKNEKNYIEKKIEFLGIIMVLSGCITIDDIRLMHELCKKYNKSKTEFEFITTCNKYLKTFHSMQNYWDSKKMDWIKRITYQISEIYALGLINEYLIKYKNLSEEDISNITDVTKLPVEDVKTLLEKAKKTIKQRRKKKSKEKIARKPGGESVGE